MLARSLNSLFAERMRLLCACLALTSDFLSVTACVLTSALKVRDVNDATPTELCAARFWTLGENMPSYALMDERR